ncbi:hypothetical protein SAMN06298214_0104 [Bacteroidales bacterium WCE2004]|nr:hypothetical protein SAMN06298214_0104 [Bacteroidales bacterium WCE2004]
MLRLAIQSKGRLNEESTASPETRYLCKQFIDWFSL